MGKYFMTGGSGFIGSHFHEVIDHKQIVNFDIRKPFSHLKSTYVSGNVRNLDELEDSIVGSSPETIIALAAEHKDFGVDRESYFLTNEYGTENICKAASKAGVKSIIFYSSVAVYGNNKTPSTESMEPKPNLPYGESKLAGEKVLREWASEDGSRKVIIMRPAVVYGERNVANMFRLIQQINKGRYFNIGKGENIKSIAYVKNLVEATLYLEQELGEGVHTFNYADEPQMNSRSIGLEISKKLDKKSPVTIPYMLAMLMGVPFDLFIKLTGKDIPISTNRIKKFCTETFHKADKIREAGFQAKYSNLEGLQRMVSWQKNDYDSTKEYFDV